MIKEKKFLHLKTITRQKKIADSLLIFRNSLLSNDEIVDTSSITMFFSYYKNNLNLLELDEYIIEGLKQIIETFSEANNNNNNNNNNKQDYRVLLEKVHYLYHEIMEKIGYPVSEKQFIQKTGDRFDLKYKEISSKKSDLVIILDNLRSAFNVGSIIRLADCLGVKEIFSLGLTPDIHNDKVVKTSKDSEKFVKFTKSNDFLLLLGSLKNDGYKIVTIETAEKSKNLNNFIFHTKTALVLGNEEIGVSQKILDICDEVVEIDMKGFKRSLNVSNAAGIVINEYNRQIS